MQRNSPAARPPARSPGPAHHQPVQCGVILPGGTAPAQVELAVAAEQAGWDGVFVWESGYGPDAWSMLAAMAARTSRVRLGTMVTPLPFRRPWKVASQAATLDQLSAGRAILAVGIGAADDDLPDTGEVTGVKERAALLDEGIDLVRTLWAGGRSFTGEHYRYRQGQLDLAAVTAPVQDPVPVWVVGAWPAPKSMRRALRCDGLIPQYQEHRAAGREPEPQDAAAVREWLTGQGKPAGFDLIADGQTPAGDPASAAATVAGWAGAGCTWWLETRWGDADGQKMAARIAAGPPRPA